MGDIFRVVIRLMQVGDDVNEFLTDEGINQILAVCNVVSGVPHVAVYSAGTRQTESTMNVATDRLGITECAILSESRLSLSFLLGAMPD